MIQMLSVRECYNYGLKQSTLGTKPEVILVMTAPAWRHVAVNSGLDPGSIGIGVELGRFSCQVKPHTDDGFDSEDCCQVRIVPGADVRMTIIALEQK